MSKLVRTLTCCSAIVAFPATAAAGPVPTWTYSAQVVGADSPGGTPRTALYTIAGYDLGGRSGIDALHQVQPAPVSGFAGEAAVVISTVGVRGSTGQSILPRDFRYQFEVTDSASGEFYQFGFGGRLETTPQTDHNGGDPVSIPGGGQTSFAFDGPAGVTRRIGDNVYDVEFVFRTYPHDPTSYQSGWFEATVTPTSVDTPEPATIALAGIALSLAGVTRLARRKPRTIAP